MKLSSAAVSRLPLLLLLIFPAVGTRVRRRCKYTKSVQWSSCDPVLHIQTRSLPLVRGTDLCPETKTVTRPCNAGIHINGCTFVAVSTWSQCDPTTLTSTRTLELRSHTSSSIQCDNTQLQSRDCRDNVRSKNFKDNIHSKDFKDMRKDRRNNRRKHRRRGRARRKDKRRCRYKKGKWSACDPQSKEKIRTRELRKGPSSCQKKKTTVKKCNPKWPKSERKNAQDNPTDVQVSPPKLREMQVWPSFTSVEVLWSPPDQGTVRGYQVGYGISVPDVYLIQVNASVLHYIIQDLEPEQEYIVSLRARNKAGLGSPLYETVRTGRVKDSNKTGPLLLAPVGVRAITVSAEAIEVSWSDSSVLKLRGGMKDTGKVYTVRYMQLNHLTLGTKPKFVTATTSEASLLIEGLLPYTRYEFAVRVAQGSDRSVWSMAIANTTFASDSWVQLKAPVDVQVTILSSTSAIMNWHDPNQSTRFTHEASSQLRASSFTVRYSVYVTSTNTTTTTAITTVSNSSLGEGVANYTYLSPPLFSSLYVDNLTPSTMYEFAVQLNRGAWQSAWSLPVYNKTLEDDYMMVQKDMESEVTVQTRVAGDTLMAVVNDLLPARTYHFSVQPVFRHGSGPHSAPVHLVVPQEITDHRQH